MKRLFYFYILVSMCIIMACERDFDEIRDSDQRHITFEFETDDIFADMIHYQNGEFYTEKVNNLPPDCKVRISTYCYDDRDSLIYKTHKFSALNVKQRIKVSHLNKDKEYNFVFIADIVEFYTPHEYMETWYQMKTWSYDSFYIYSDNRSANLEKNVLGKTNIRLQPNNQIFQISFTPITYHGFIEFSNLDHINLLEGDITYSASFAISSLKQLYLANIGYKFRYLNPSEKSLILPVSLNYADDLFAINIGTTVLGSSHSRTFTIKNQSKRPFVITLDCDELELTNCKFY